MIELLIAACLILVNGVFALSELAVVSSRKTRLTLLAKQGRAGAAAALKLTENPGRFLSTVQIGITLIGILAGVFSGAALGDRVGDFLELQGLPPRTASVAGYVLVISAITFFAIVVGELVPKNLALKNAEGFACIVAPLMVLLSRVAAPVVLLLDATTRGILFLAGMRSEPQGTITDEEIRSVIAEAEAAGVIAPQEQAMISGVMRLGDRTARGLMTPRTGVDMLDARLEGAALVEALLSSPHSRIPVHEGDPDTILGMALVRDLTGPLLSGRKVELRAHVRPAPVVPETMDALAVLKVLREAEVPVALVHDEFGHFEGLITPADILDAIAGAFRSDEEGEEPEATQRPDGSWLVSGWMPADEMAALLRIELPGKRGYDTAAGFLLEAFKRIPTTGECVELQNWRFEVVDLDGRRIDKILATKIG